MAKYKFSPESSQEQLNNYFHVSSLSGKMIRQLQKLDADRLTGLISEMPYLAKHLSAKTMEYAYQESPAFINGFIKEDNVLESLTAKQKLALAPALVTKDPQHILEIPNKLLKKLPVEDKTKLIEDSVVGMLKGKDAELNLQNVKALSQHLVQNKGLFGRNHNFDANLFLNVVNRVSKDFPVNGPKMLDTFFSASQQRLLEAKGRAEIVQTAIANGVSLGSFPPKLRTADMIYRAVMKRPEDIQFSPKPVNKNMFEAFLNATANKIMIGKETDKYVAMLSELIKNKSLTDPALNLHKKVNNKFIQKCLLKTIKKNPELFIKLNNLKDLGFNDKTILANKILAVKAMNPTKQRKFFATLNHTELKDLVENMKKLPSATRQNFAKALKEKANLSIAEKTKTLNEKQSAFDILNKPYTAKEIELYTEADKFVETMRVHQNKVDTKSKEIAEKDKDAKIIESKILTMNEAIKSSEKGVTASKDALTALEGKYKSEITLIKRIEKDIADTLNESKEIKAKLQAKLPAKEKKVLMAEDAKLNNELKTLREELAKENETFAKTPAGIEMDGAKRSLEAKETALATLKKEKQGAEIALTSAQTELHNLGKEKLALQDEMNKAAAAETRFTTNEVANKHFINQTLKNEFPTYQDTKLAYENAKTDLAQANKDKEVTDQYAYNLDKGKDADARISKKIKEKIKEDNSFEP